MKLRRILITLLLAVIVTICSAPKAWAFCGFYVAKADAQLYNQASQVILARNGDRTILTMANDYQGEVKDFAIVVPVPVVLQQDQVHVGDPKIIERLDSFSAPRLVEYFDPNPCPPPPPPRSSGGRRLRFRMPGIRASRSRRENENSLGVTVEARFSVGEYDILILSAKESNGLETWLRQSGYQLPVGANQLLRPYIRQNMKFFVAKVNLEEFDKTGYQYLRPLQIAFQSPRFMLPIRLGMMNATTEQDLIVYILSPQGQGEISNYRTVNIPSDSEVPVFVKSEFNDFYKAMFQTAYIRERKNIAFREYAWDMAWCDPCAAEPLSREELQKAGVFWLPPDTSNNVFITRLHIRYNRQTFPEDLMFQETTNKQKFQGRYIVRHPFRGDMDCRAGERYKRSLQKRFEREAQTLAKLTGWDIQDINNQMNQSVRWWRTIWD